MVELHYKCKRAFELFWVVFLTMYSKFYHIISINYARIPRVYHYSDAYTYIHFCDKSPLGGMPMQKENSGLATDNVLWAVQQRRAAHRCTASYDATSVTVKKLHDVQSTSGSLRPALEYHKRGGKKNWFPTTILPSLLKFHGSFSTVWRIQVLEDSKVL